MLIRIINNIKIKQEHLDDGYQIVFFLTKGSIFEPNFKLNIL